MIEEAQLFNLQAALAGSDAQQLQHTQDIAALHEVRAVCIYIPISAQLFFGGQQ